MDLALKVMHDKIRGKGNFRNFEVHISDGTNRRVCKETNINS